MAGSFERKKQYEDMLDLPHPVSAAHPQMSRQDRAAQFAPFSALTGHGAAIRETARLTDERMELDEYEKAELDRKLRLLRDTLRDQQKTPYCDSIRNRPAVTIEYFLPDEKKTGGSYVKAVGIVKRIDDYRHELVMEDGMAIPVGEIVALELDEL